MNERTALGLSMSGGCLDQGKAAVLLPKQNSEVSGNSESGLTYISLSNLVLITDFVADDSNKIFIHDDNIHL